MGSARTPSAYRFCEGRQAARTFSDNKIRHFLLKKFAAGSRSLRRGNTVESIRGNGKIRQNLEMIGRLRGHIDEFRPETGPKRIGKFHGVGAIGNRVESECRASI